jgi:hypothetical protein
VVANFFVHYEIDDQTAKHRLMLEQYGGDDLDCWVLLKRVEAWAEAELEARAEAAAEAEAEEAEAEAVEAEAEAVEAAHGATADPLPLAPDESQA